MNAEVKVDTQSLWNEIAAEREGNTSKPVEKPVEQPAAKTETPAPEVVETPDPLKTLTDKMADIEKLVGRVRNVEGHIGSLNSSTKEIKALLEASKQVADKGTKAPTTDEVKQAIENPSEWKDLKNDYPEWAVGIEKFVESRIPASPQFDAKAFEAEIKAQLKGETDAVRQEIIDSALDVVLPNWKDEVKTETFSKWMSTQPDEIKALAASTKVGDAAKMLKAYDTHRENNPVNQIIEQRKSVLNAATGTPKGVTKQPTTQKSWEDMNANERWEYEKRAREKRNR